MSIGTSEPFSRLSGQRQPAFVKASPEKRTAIGVEKPYFQTFIEEISR